MLNVFIRFFDLGGSDQQYLPWISIGTLAALYGCASEAHVSRMTRKLAARGFVIKEIGKYDPATGNRKTHYKLSQSTVDKVRQLLDFAQHDLKSTERVSIPAVASAPISEPTSVILISESWHDPSIPSMEEQNEILNSFMYVDRVFSAETEPEPTPEPRKKPAPKSQPKSKPKPTYNKKQKEIYDQTGEITDILLTKLRGWKATSEILPEVRKCIKAFGYSQTKDCLEFMTMTKWNSRRFFNNVRDYPAWAKKRKEREKSREVVLPELNIEKVEDPVEVRAKQLTKDLGIGYLDALIKATEGD